MADNGMMARYRQRLARVRQALASPATWAALPELLDELDGARRGALTSCHDAEEAWVDLFVAALPAIGAQHTAAGAEGTARALWPRLGGWDPQALAAGRWDKLPRSHA